ncbi:DNA-processing protein DprA [Blastochloris sulfoviridis]|uniref:DNA-protecting protein DprA n=1 Tax=Blastochloris sulfoviridis TaxID=50712 RepID=A0A5M6HT58_9HYPH|nr:DNA-processing protein DprA [Blastochloris sulfoviridis]KAA5598985.1 DNA-protecting protein DprA [Blastochloris sulfoviridis]
MTGPAGRCLDEATRLDWLRLWRCQNVGPRTFRALVNHYGSARAAIEALPTLAKRGGGRSIKVATRDEIEREVAAARRLGVAFIALGEPDYPPRLREEDDSPPLLAVRGQTEVLTRPMVAIVGARNASAAGQKMAAMLARDLGAAGFVISSGLARGIDASAHDASLATGTVAVLAGGHDRPYPPENIPLLDRLTGTGAAVSEMPMGWEPRGRDFPRRNRLISGMALGVVVVEAAERSGSLITARLAGEQGREVFAVPGSPIDPRASGSNRLLKQGATLVTEAADVIEALRPILERPRVGLTSGGFASGGLASMAPLLPLTPADKSLREPDQVPVVAAPDDSLRDRIAALLGPAPVSIDDLIRLTAASAAAVQVVVLELDLAGRLTRLGNGLVTAA